MNNVTDARLFYKKTGDMKFISHLDMNRCMQRVLRRSRLPIWYTEGFNPHVYITFALPLSLGIESLYETMDFRLTDGANFEDAERLIAPVLPEGLTLIKAAAPKMKVSEIALADFSVCASGSDESVLHRWNDYFAQDEIITSKKTKAGMKDIDVKPHIMQQEEPVFTDGKLCLTLRLAAGSTVNINPMLLFNNFIEKTGTTFSRVDYTKLAVYNKNGILFE